MAAVYEADKLPSLTITPTDPFDPLEVLTHQTAGPTPDIEPLPATQAYVIISPSGSEALQLTSAYQSDASRTGGSITNVVIIGARLGVGVGVGVGVSVGVGVALIVGLRVGVGVALILCAVCQARDAANCCSIVSILSERSI